MLLLRDGALPLLLLLLTRLQPQTSQDGEGESGLTLFFFFFSLTSSNPFPTPSSLSVCVPVFPRSFCPSFLDSFPQVGADIANLCNEAAIQAARRRSKTGVEQQVRNLLPPSLPPCLSLYVSPLLCPSRCLSGGCISLSLHR